MNLLFVPEEDLIHLSEVYSELASKNHSDKSLMAFYCGRMRPYIKELKSRGIDWKRRKR